MATELSNEDNFTAAFDQLAALDGKPTPSTFNAPTPEPPAKVEPPVTVVPPSVTGDPAPEASAIEGLTPEEIAAAGDEKTPTPEELAAETAAATAREEEARLLAAQEAEDNRLAKIVKAIKSDDKPAPKADTQSQPQAVYSSEDIAVLQGVEKDWPDVAKAMSIQARALAANITAHIFAEMGKVLGPKIAMYDELLERSHVENLHKIDGYETDRDKVIAWVDQQPSYLQTAMKRVVQEGTVDEVADLINRYRRDTGAASTSRAAPVVSAIPAKELSPAAKKAVVALAPVPAKRSSAVQAVGPDDFDGAFAQAARDLEELAKAS